MKRCRKCGQERPVEDFRSKGLVSSMRDTKRGTCKQCEGTQRYAEKFSSKARRTIATHAKKWKMAAEEFRRKFDWPEIDILARELEITFKHGFCPHCRRFYRDMYNGLWDLTIDIIDPQKPPYWSVNTRYVCSNNNSSKGHKDPMKYAIELAEWRNRCGCIGAPMFCSCRMAMNHG